MVKHLHRSEKVYNDALRMYNAGCKKAEISNVLNIPYPTVYFWCRGITKPRCISEKCKRFNKTRHINLGKYSTRKSIFLDRLCEHEIAYLIGAYLGDGNSYTGFDMQVKDKEFAEYVASLLENICNHKVKVIPYRRKRKDRKTNEKGFRIRVHCRQLKDWLEKTTKNKTTIPKFKTKKEILWFFSGFYDSEGTVKYGGTQSIFYNGVCMYLAISQKNKAILQQLQNYLNKINIKCSINGDRIFLLKIFGKNNIRELLNGGNIQIKRKKEKIREYVNRNYKFTKTHKENLSLSKRGLL